ncbi:MAG: serine/threonine-protein kinase [Planctomycetota bacterium]
MPDPNRDDESLDSPETHHDRTEVVRPEGAGSDFEHTLAVSEQQRAGAATGQPERLGPFRILRELGRGGMGVVYLAEDEGLDRRVALKVLPDTFGGAPALVARFKREAEVASRLDHPHLCGVLRVGETDGRHWIAMRYVPGVTLEQVLRDGPAEERLTRTDESRSVTGVDARLAPSLVLLEKVARALHAAHESGVVHRDLKPGNVMIDERGEPVVLDFGLALDLQSEDGAALTQSGDVLGTPYYMAPEQIRGEAHRADPRVDVWAMGVMLYEVFAGRRPFEAPTRDALYRSILEDDPPRLRKVAPGLPRDLETIVETALAKSPERRYASGADLAEDLRALMEIRPIKARPVGPVEKLAKFVRRRPALAGLIVVLAVAIPVLSTLLVARAIDRGRLADSVAQYRAEARSAIEDGRPRAARRAVAAAGRIRAGDAWASDALAEAARLEAFEAARTVLFDDDADPEGWRAETLTAELLERWRDRPEPHVWSALAALRRGDEAAARARLEGARAVVPEASRMIEALGLDADALAARPARGDLLGLFETALLSLRGRPMQALERLELAAEAEPRAHVLAWLAAEEASRTQGFRAALAWAGRARALLDGLSPLQKGRYSLHLRRAGHVDEALVLAREAAAEAPEDPLVRFHLAAALSHSGEDEAAIAEYRALLADAPGMAVAWRNLGASLIDLDRMAEAEEVTARAVALAADDATSRVNHAVTLLSLGRATEAEAEFREALRLQPGMPFALNNLGTCLRELGRLEEAKAANREAVERKPDYAEGWYNLGRIEKDLGDSEGAARSFRRAIELDREFAEPEQGLGTIEIEAGRAAEAVAHYRRALEIDPAARMALTNLPLALEATGEVDAAIEVGADAVTLWPLEAQAQSNHAAVLIRAQHLDEGRAVMWDSFELMPEEERPVMMLSVLLAESDTPAAAAFITRLEHLGSDLFKHVEAFVPTLLAAVAELEPESPLGRAAALRTSPPESAEARTAALEAALAPLEGAEIPADRRAALLENSALRVLAGLARDDAARAARVAKELERREAEEARRAKARAGEREAEAAAERDRRRGPRGRQIRRR